MSRRNLAVAFTLAAALAIAPLPALATSITPVSKNDWAPNQELPFRWKEGAVPPQWMRTAVVASAGHSTNSRGAKAGQLLQRDGAVSWVAYTNEIPNSAAIAYASRRVPDSFNVRIRPQGHFFDWGQLRWCQFFAAPPDGCFDAEMVALHEFGHIQGLGHIENAADPGDWLDSVMHTLSRAKPKLGWNVHAFGPCDVAALQTRYEALTAATPISTCLSLAASLSLSASAATVASGSAVTFSGTLRIAADVAYPRLANDPLSSRVVILQRRTVGASSWSSYATMPAGPADGGYRISLKPSATYEWRALFPKPASEGLLGAASAVVKITVTASTGCNPYCVE